MIEEKKWKKALFLAFLFLTLAAGRVPGAKISCAAAGERVQVQSQERAQVQSQEQGQTQTQAITLSETELVMTRRGTHKLKLEGADGTVRWKSSDTSVASVSSSGRVKARKAGVCVVTAKYRKQSYRCRVRVYTRTLQWRPQWLAQTYRPKKEKGKILLAGSSYMERWEDAQDALTPFEVLNMGIAGSKADDWMKLSGTLIEPYQPQAVVLCIGDNNMHGSKGSESGSVTAAKVIRVLQRLQQKFPKMKIFYVSVAPTPRCWHVWDDVRECNRRVKNYCKSKENLSFIDVTSRLLKDGKLQKKLYCADRLHLNEEGYQIWGEAISRRLRKEKTLLR